jgi:hypothetical protein
MSSRNKRVVTACIPCHTRKQKVKAATSLYASKSDGLSSAIVASHATIARIVVDPKNAPTILFRPPSCVLLRLAMSPRLQHHLATTTMFDHRSLSPLAGRKEAFRTQWHC